MISLEEGDNNNLISTEPKLSEQSEVYAQLTSLSLSWSGIERILKVSEQISQEQGFPILPSLVDVTFLDLRPRLVREERSGNLKQIQKFPTNLSPFIQETCMFPCVMSGLTSLKFDGMLNDDRDPVEFDHINFQDYYYEGYDDYYDVSNHGRPVAGYDAHSSGPRVPAGPEAVGSP